MGKKLQLYKLSYRNSVSVEPTRSLNMFLSRKKWGLGGEVGWLSYEYL